MEIKTIDISSHNGNVDFEKVKNFGIENVILRCGYTGYGIKHTLNEDSNFEINYKNAKAVGMNVGTYYYSVATNEEDADRESNFVMTLLKNKQFELPIYFDVEDQHDTNSDDVHPESMKEIGKSRLTKVVERFCSNMEKAGYFVGIYSSTWWYNNLLDMSILDKYSIWVAQYNNELTYTGKYDMWQYSENGSVDGVSGKVDMNYLYKDFSNDIKNKGLNNFKNNEPITEIVIDKYFKVVGTDSALNIRSGAGIDFSIIGSNVDNSIVYGTKQFGEWIYIDNKGWSNISYLKEIIKGDINGDGKVTSEDARLALRASVGLEELNEEQLIAGDIDGDGKVTINDAMSILYISAEIEENKKEQIIHGDINGDGKVTSEDARLALRASVGLEELNEEQLIAGDIDGDGKVTSSDSRAILRKSVNLDS